MKSVTSFTHREGLFQSEEKKQIVKILCNIPKNQDIIQKEIIFGR